MAQYLMPQRRQSGDSDALAVIAQGLQIANSVYGLKTAMDRTDMLEQDQAWKAEDRKISAEQRAYERRLSEEDRASAGEDRAFKKSEQDYALKKRTQKDQGTLDKATLLDLQKDYQISNTPSEGALQFQDEGGSPLYIKARAKYKWEAGGLGGGAGGVGGGGGSGGGLRTPKQIKDERERTVPGVGLAMTREDAKTLKAATEMKKDFDRKLTEMIQLREKHDGGAFWNRDDVGRGKQLSKDLLLTYKELAKLGVLSQADEDILNAIIPPDPLAFDFIPNQDPIMTKLRKFKEDANADYQTRLSTRLEKPLEQEAAGESSFDGITPEAALQELERRKKLKK